MLADQNVVVRYAAQRVSVGLARFAPIAGCGPRWGRDLQHHSVSVVVPCQHPFGMAPGRELGLERICVKLIVPKHVIKLAVVNLVEGSAQRIGCCITSTPATGPKG